MKINTVSVYGGEKRSILKVNMVSGGGEHCHQYFYRKKNGKYYNEQGNELTEYLKLVNSYKYFKVLDIR